MEIREALDKLYDSATTERTITMRQFLGLFDSNAAAASALSGGADKKSHAYKAAIRDVQRYQQYIRGVRTENVRNPDKVTVRTLQRAGRAAGRERARKGGIRVTRYKGKIRTSPKRKKGRLVDLRDENRVRLIQRPDLPITPRIMRREGVRDILDGDEGAFSAAFLTAYGAGPIGELYDIEDLKLEFADLDDEGDDEDEGGDDE